MGALVLGLKEKDSFWIMNSRKPSKGDVQVILDKIHFGNRFKLRVIYSMDHIHTITDQRSTEIFKGVRVSAGKGSTDMARVAIEADSGIRILRHALYTRKK